MIRGIKLALARRSESAAQAPQSSGPAAANPQDTLAKALPPRGRVELLPPSAFGVSPPKFERIDLTELTLEGDLAWQAGDADKACESYERLAKRFPTQPLPIVKLMCAYRKIDEKRGFKQAAVRLATLLPDPKAQAVAFMALFGDRSSQASDILLNLSLSDALALGQTHGLSRLATSELLKDARCAKQPLLFYALERGTPADIEAVLRLVRRIGDVPALRDHFAVALTMVEGWSKRDVLEQLLRSGIRPGTSEHLDRLVDIALEDGRGKLLAALLSTGLIYAYTREVEGAMRSVPQLLLLSPCLDWALASQMRVLNGAGLLWMVVPGGETLTRMAMRRGGTAVAALLDVGLQIESRDSASGNTPLIEAAALNARSAVGVLLGRGANIGAVNNAGLNAIDMARLQGFGEIERQVRQFPAQERLSKVLTLLWGEDFWLRHGLPDVQTRLHGMDADHLANLLTYLPPLIGLGTLSDDFSTGEPWTLKTMRAKRLPAVIFADRQQRTWREVVATLVRWAEVLTTTKWQALQELFEGVTEPRWVNDGLEALRGREGLGSDHWKALANSISGAAYKRPPSLRVHIILYAVELRHQYGAKACAALDWLNEIPLRDFTARAYHVVMLAFVNCASQGGDCALLAQFVRDKADVKNSMGLRPSLRERLMRIDAFADSLWGGGEKANASESPRANRLEIGISRGFTEAHAAVMAAGHSPWVDRADVICREAITRCVRFFGSASEMESIENERVTAGIGQMLVHIFGSVRLDELLRTSDVSSQIRKHILSWHPDKASAERASIAVDMTTLLLALRELLEDSPLRTKLLAHAQAVRPTATGATSAQPAEATP